MAEWNLFQYGVLITTIVCAFITGVAFLMCATTWMLIPKWRTFKHYVYTNVMLSLHLTYLQNMIEMHFEFTPVVVWLDNFTASVCMCWLLVVSFASYLSLAKIYTGTSTRLMLMTTVFGWGLPLLHSTVPLLTSHFLQTINVITLIIINLLGLGTVIAIGNLVLYTKVMITLAKETAPELDCGACAMSRRVKMKRAILIFFSTNFLTLIETLQTVLVSDASIRKIRAYTSFRLRLHVSGHLIISFIFGNDLSQY
ncbi:hypothetical protein EVAR_22045_1 [Eumeta japonica]|uniref:G-protein coupled receptors family 2 profile 2 domain-containing protein n=1 Tax=Eumeta variegata TaxID=151549 RepID=A0A4C1USI4_EUMVA|nr:hypothetical protein EVAR_22045_1 [Eumeta japonica]